MSKNISIITIHEEIKVIGLSHLKSGLPNTVESLEQMWRIFGQQYRGKMKNAVASPVDYGLNVILAPDKHEYIAGCAVTEIGNLDKDWASHVIPPGRYIKYSRRKIAELFEDNGEVKAWADANGVPHGDEEGLLIEVYPAGAFDDADGKDTEAYLLIHIQEAQT